jgi:steroid 5-alpha reductase family enzyme
MIRAILISLVVSLIINIAMFIVAYIRQSDKLTDISYAISFFVLACVALARATPNLYDYILFAMVCIWAIRIGGFLLYRVVKKGRDARFDDMRSHFWRFAKFWIGQAFTVWILMLPAVIALYDRIAIPAFGYVAIGVWLIGFVVEAVADLQKYRFSSNPSNHGHWIDEGIWHYARHPNYFGEILVWTGIFFYAAAGLHGWQLVIGAISPLFIATMLLFVSGIPILEKSADKKWGGDKQYLAYKRSTSLLVPLPKQHGSH